MKKRDIKFQIVLNVFFIILCAIIVFPFLLLVAVSLSNEQDIALHGYNLVPKHIDFTAYRYVLKSPDTLLQAYKVTGIASVAYMAISVVLMSMIAYALTVKGLKGRSLISFLLYFTMLFSGGLVPSYILITRYLHLNDTIWVYIIPGLISPWYIFMMRTFMQGLPEALRESAKIDGASEFTVFFRIIIPLSKPVLATVALFMFLTKWNDWYTAMLYINKDELVSLQYLLQRILQDVQMIENMRKAGMTIDVAEKVPSETTRMALAVFVAGPALFVFPFFQKYFVRGITIGSVKG